MSGPGVSKMIYLRDGQLSMRVSSMQQTVEGVPNIRMYGDRLQVECHTITREAFLKIAQAWAEFLEEPEKGRAL